MALTKELLDTLVCVESHESLIYLVAGDCDDKEWLFCYESRLKYPVVDALPVMLVEEATRLDQSDADELLATAKNLGRVAS